MTTALRSLNAAEAQTAGAIFERLLPAGEDGPGATEIGVVAYLERALAGEYADLAETYRLGLAAFDRAARELHRAPFTELTEDLQDDLLARLERGALPGFRVPRQEAFFALLRAHLQEGAFADPGYGGNRDKRGWRLLGHPGIWFENSAEENLAGAPVTKGGEIRALAEVGRALGDAREPHEPRRRGSREGDFRDHQALREPEDIPGYEPQRGAEAPARDIDVVVVGVGAAGAQAVATLTAAGLRVVGLEAGPWRTKLDFVPDELSSAYYCRGAMGAKYLSEAPRWRTREDADDTRPVTFSLGRMMNGVGGSVFHWGGALRRFHPHHFAYRSYVRDAFGDGVLPDGHTLVDWPLGLDDLEPHLCEVEHHIGVAGDESNPWVRRSRPLPLPPLRPFTMGERFREAATRMGLHPYPTPVAVFSRPYRGFPATRYGAWSGGFGPFNDERWHPTLTWVPRPHQRRGVPRRRRPVSHPACAHGDPLRLHARERAPAAALPRRASPVRAGQPQRRGGSPLHDEDVG